MAGSSRRNRRFSLLLLWRPAGCLFALAAVAGCSSASGLGHPTVTQPPRVDTASSHQVVAGVVLVHVDVREQCQWTADAVGYPVPCPTVLPEGMIPTPVPPQAHLHCHHNGIVAAGDSCGGKLWRGWIAASSQNDYEHLLMQGAPSGVHLPVHVIGGPAWSARYGGTSVRPLGVVRVDGQTMRWYFVPPTPGNETTTWFVHHLVLLWTKLGHTYAYGFHVNYSADGPSTFAVVRALDLELARHLVTVHPQ